MYLLCLKSLLTGNGSEFAPCKSWIAWAYLSLTSEHRNRLNENENILKIFWKLIFKCVFKYDFRVQLYPCAFKILCKNHLQKTLLGLFLVVVVFYLERWHVSCHLCQQWDLSLGRLPELIVWVTAFTGQHSSPKPEAPSVLQALENKGCPRGLLDGSCVVCVVWNPPCVDEGSCCTDKPPSGNFTVTLGKAFWSISVTVEGKAKRGVCGAALCLAGYGGI